MKIAQLISGKLPNDLGTDLSASQQAELDQRWAESKKDPSAAFRRRHPLVLDPLHANVIVDRYQQFTGKPAVLESTNRQLSLPAEVLPGVRP